MDKIHLVPSGSDKTLCGLDKDSVKDKYFSLGITCTCEECYRIGQELLEKQKRAKGVHG